MFAQFKKIKQFHRSIIAFLHNFGAIWQIVFVHFIRGFGIPFILMPLNQIQTFLENLYYVSCAT